MKGGGKMSPQAKKKRAQMLISTQRDFLGSWVSGLGC